MPLIEKSKVKVEIGPERTYSVLVESSYTEELFRHIISLNASSIFLFTQENLKDLCEGFLREAGSISGLNLSNVIYLKDGEEYKHLNQLGSVYNRLIEQGADRKTLLISLGGGVVGDFTGFVAATLFRGIPFVQIPTTLLAAVDASVGGKVAINVDKGKNMVGAFHQPSMVFFNLENLRSLPEKEWVCGHAEMIKHAFLDPSGDMFSWLDEHSSELRDPSSSALKKAVLDSIAFKAEVVEKDETELGLRAILNLGHTTAHALESFTHYSRFSHGEAVSRGLVTMMYISGILESFPEEDKEQCIALMEKLNLPMDTAGISGKDLLEHLKFDKKTISGIPRFVLLEKRGKYKFDVKVSEEVFLRAWQMQRERFG